MLLCAHCVGFLLPRLPAARCRSCAVFNIWPYSSARNHGCCGQYKRGQRVPERDLLNAFSGVRLLAARWPTANESFKN